MTLTGRSLRATDLPDATTLSDDVRARRRTAVEVVTEHLDRIAEIDPKLNAFHAVRREAALAEAAAVDANPARADLPLAGVPVAMKDNTAVAGEQVRHGSEATSDAPAPEDDEVVARVRAAGGVVVGTTRMPELAIWGFTSSTTHGVTRNPWDPELDTGGSSGGAASAVASGMAAIAVGTDGGGSIRIPSAACGLVGVKTTRGLVPLPGGVDEHWLGLSVAGPIARSVRDASLLLDVLAGRPVQPLEAVGRLRVAVSLKSPSPLGRADTHHRAAVDAARARLETAGHRVDNASPGYPMTMLNDWTAVWLTGIAEDVENFAEDEDRLERRTRTMARFGRRIAKRGGPDRSKGERWRARATEFFADHDVLVTPVVARGPGRAGAMNGRGLVRTYLASARSVPFTQAWNWAGFPAVVVPVGERDGLPLAVQLVGLPDTERQLLAVAAQLSES